MGQGVRSSLPVLIADELGADMKRLKIVQADGDEKYGRTGARWGWGRMGPTCLLAHHLHVAS